MMTVPSLITVPTNFTTDKGFNYCMFAAIPPATQSYVLQSYPSSTVTTASMTAARTIDVDVSARMLNGKFPCANCTSVFSRKGGLTYHQKYECGQEPRFKCPYCGYCAKHISNARRHVRKCHPGRDVYAVDLCTLHQRNP
ncbi:zinc finger protein 534-like [Temnothorax curvispinosus]|uniref:Zinc finger protein 534-like n=1 Tax=Temnothorax curvispinosus TaxID=300111 RepID=A0A6J1Q0C2_9HYME|nr:zinc finger protein 534-like [Temnothorax curvispinosus]